MDYNPLREEVCHYARKIAESGLVVGSSGNISVRGPGDNCYIITPTSLTYGEMTPANIVVCDQEGDQLVEVENAPSIELPLHVAVYKARPDVNAIFHTHAIFSTVLAVNRLCLPPITEEMVPYLGGEVQVSQYAQAGSEELAANVAAALGPRAAALIANHGNLAVGKNLAKAWAALELVERTARIYVESLRLEAGGHGKVHSLPAEVLELETEMYEVMKDL